MLVHVAENGHSFELDCQPSTSVEDVQSYLVSLTGVLQHDQLLIVGDSRLEPQRLLGSYQLPSDGRPVFMFNRQRLTPDSPVPPPEDPERFLERSERTIQRPSSAPSGHPLEESSDPALRALPSYERQFKYHFEKGRSIFNAGQRKLDACRMLLREQQVQEMALETARGNMEHYYKIIDQLYQEFMRHFTRQHRQHTDLLTNFQRDVERLRHCKLHPALKSDSRRTLLDCVKEGSLRKWADECAISHKQFFGKVSQLKNEYIILQRSVEDLLVTGSSIDVRLLEETIDNHVHYTEEQASIIQSLSKDVNTVRKLIDNCINSQYSASLRPHDAVSALGPMYDVHDKNHLSRMEACDRELQKLLEACIRSKNTMSIGVHMRMQNVAALQSSIRDMRNQLSAFKEAMARQDDIFEELKLVRKVGYAYKACLAEVVRRKACMKLYMGQAGQLAEKLARKREMEIARREEFLQQQSLYIPRDILGSMGLFDGPSQCVVNIAPFDLGLLDIDISDIERYAPESLVGPLYKMDPSASSLALGNTVPEVVDSEINDTDEIAGTSKLEVENTRLKANYAEAISMLCHLDPDFEAEGTEFPGDTEGHRSLAAAKKTAEALRLKDVYAKQLHDMLNVRQHQCNAYEKRIRELEERLREQHVQMQKMCSDEGLVSKEYSDASTVTRSSALPEPMDEGVTSRPNRDASEQQVDEKLDESMVEPLSGKSSLALQDELAEKSRQCVAAEETSKAAMCKVVQLQTELENNDLLRECQMNCAHLENQLHEAREEAKTSLCAADRRACEYNALRMSSVKLRGLMERLKNCISNPVDGNGGLVECLRALSNSIAASDNGDEQAMDFQFQACIRIIAERVASLAQQRSEVVERCGLAEVASLHLAKELENKSEMLKNLYAKRKLEKQAFKEKICFTRFEVHELAVFIPNANGHYEALNRNCPNYYLSRESIALFIPEGQDCIVGQIVHINKNTARSPPSSPPPSNSESNNNSESKSDIAARYNPYGLPVGCEYFVVTVAMVPEFKN